MYALSPRFEILAADATPSGTSTAKADPEAATVTVSGSPDPTKQFATTFPAVESGARVAMGLDGAGIGMIVALVGCAGGALWTLW